MSSYFYRQSLQVKAEKGSQLYESMIKLVLTPKPKEKEKALGKEIEAMAQQLVLNYKGTPYASIAGLMLARLAIEEDKLEQAVDPLRFVIRNSGRTVLGHVARVRLAKVLESQKKYSEALALLNGNPGGYAMLYQEVKGDIYLLQNDLKKAREAYALATHAVPQGVANGWLQLKQADLGKEPS